jgi:hypothetical protein
MLSTSLSLLTCRLLRTLNVVLLPHMARGIETQIGDSTVGTPAALQASSCWRSDSTVLALNR